MIKKSHRKKLNELNPTQIESDVYKRCIKIGNLINKLFSTYFRVPNGYYRCPKCDSNPPLPTAKHLTYIFSPLNGEKIFAFASCGFCKGTGYIDFITNAIKPIDREASKCFDKAVIIPFHEIDSSDFEIASVLFYNMYAKHKFLGFNLNFKNPNLNIKKNSTLNQFIQYFIEYKKSRDRRIKFLDKNFEDIRKIIFAKTKISDLPSGKISCTQCNSQSSDIERFGFSDTVRIKICGKCYGLGYQSKRDTKAVTGFYLCDVPNADYSNKKRMLKELLADIDLNVENILFALMKIEFEEKQKKIGEKS